MTKDLISFVILTYKNFEGIYDTLDSVFMQNYPYIEIVISDDGSPNAYEELPKIKKYIEKNKSDNIVNVIINSIKDNVGTVRNLNSALKLTNGEYIKELGADDTLSCSDALTRYKNFIDEKECLICVSKLNVIDINGNYNENFAIYNMDYNSLKKLKPKQLRNKLFGNNFIPAPCVFFKKELFDKYGYYPKNTRLIEDYPFWLYLCEQNVKIEFFDDRLVDYKLTGVSCGNYYSKVYMMDMITIYENYIFPNDRRFGLIQPLYNIMKKGLLKAYMAKAEWDNYGFIKKIIAYTKYGVYFFHFKMNEVRMKRKIKNK